MQTFEGKLQRFELKKINTPIHKAKISSSQDIAEYIKQIYSDDLEVYESMYLITLNRANNTTGYARISQGGLSGTVVDVRLVAKYALDSLSHAVILVHNHPSGTCSPSYSDISISTKVKDGLKLLDIKLLDHIILTADAYYSLADNGEI